MFELFLRVKLYHCMFTISNMEVLLKTVECIFFSQSLHFGNKTVEHTVSNQKSFGGSSKSSFSKEVVTNILISVIF